MPDLKQALKDFVATSNSGKYSDEETLLSKFPELKGYDIQALRDFVATSNSGKYASEDEVFSKFPEFGISKPVKVKKKDIGESNVPIQKPSTTALPSADGSLATQKPVEEEDYFTGSFGNFLRGVDEIVPIGVGDFIDDMARSVSSGYRQGSVAEAADKLLLKGHKATPEQIKKFIDANKNAQQIKPSAEMQDYNKIYEEEGKGFWGVIKGLAYNPSVIPEVLTSSLTSMATNTDALAAGSAAIGSGATYGAITGAAATPEFAGAGAIPGAAAGAASAIPYAFGLASSVVEAGSTFGELLTDELKGKELTKENVRAILENPEKLQSIRNKAIARGIIIGTVDALTGKLASGVGAKIIGKSAAKSATGAVAKAAAVKATAAGAAVESLGGAAGEAAARAATGQEMDVSEIALEGLAELPGGVRSTIQARLSKPSYRINGEKVKAEDVDDLINTMTPEQLAVTDIKIKNDYEGREFKIQDKIVTNTVKEQVKQANPDLNEPSLNAITQLEKELQTLEGNKTQTGKDKASALRNQIKGIQENQLEEETITQTVEAVKVPEEAAARTERITELENTLSPEAQVQIPALEKVELEKELETLKKEEDAVQKQTTDEGVLRAEQPQLGLQGVGEGNAKPEKVAQEETIITEKPEEIISEEPTIKDSQIPLKRETFESETDSGNPFTIEVTTNKDGSRDIVTKVEGATSGGEKVSKDNTLSTEEYITSTYGNIKGEPTIEEGIDIMAPAMKEKLTPKQKTELGIEEVPPIAETQGLSEAELPGYDNMIAKAEAIVTEKKRGRKEKEMQDAVMGYVTGSKVYEDATDVQREALVRDVRKRFGLREKTVPSVGKLFGTIKDIAKVTITEKAGLIKQIKDTAKGARESVKAFKLASQQLTKDIKELKESGKITTTQLTSILVKFSKVNVLNEASVSNFVDYMTKVFADADYANKIETAKSNLKTAKKNIVTKLGIADGLVLPLQRLFSINPTLIPDAYLGKYLSLVDMFGKKQAVLTLEEKSQTIKDVQDILDEINNERSLVDELADRFNNSENKVFKDDKLDYSASLDKMLEEGDIDSDDLALMKKYKKDIVPQVEKSKLTEKEIQEEKDGLIRLLKKSTITPSELSTRDEREKSKNLNLLIKGNAINELTNVELKNLLKVIDNINNGYFPHYAQLMIEKLNDINNSKTLEAAINKSKPLPISKLYAKAKSLLTKKDAILEMVRRNPLFNIDQVLGDFKTKDIFNSLFNKAAEAEAKFTSELKNIQHTLGKAEENVAKSFKLNANKTLMSKFKMMTYMVQLEYDSNPDNKQVNPAAEYLKATIKHIEAGKSQFGERDAEMLQEVYDKYTDSEGNIDNEKLYNSFNNAEKEAIKTIRGINESLKEKAEHTAAIIRGQKINPLNNYVHLNVLHEHKPNDLTSGESFANDYNNSLRPSTKAKSLIERTGKVSPLNFDVFASAQRGAKFVIMDYYLTEPIRTARKTINRTISNMESKGTVPKEKRQIINAINNAFEETIDNLITNNYVATSIGDDVSEYISKQGYRAVLSGTGRFASELLSNVGFVLLSDPTSFTEGIKHTGIIMSSDAPSIMNNVNSKETNRIFPTDTLSGRMIDTGILNQTGGIKGGKSKNTVVNKIQQIWNLSGKKYVNSVELLSDILISTPDKLIMRPIWFGSFSDNFKNIAGKDVDFKKIAENDEAYMEENKEAIEKAKTIADERSVVTGASSNAFTGILKGTTKVNQSATVKAFNNFNSFMSKFLIYEFVTARTGIMAAIGNGSLTKRQGIALLGAAATRMTVYSLLIKVLGEGIIGLVFDDEDDEEDKAPEKSVGQALASTFSSMLFGRDFGNITKTLVNYGLERVNENYLDFLREGKYDPYKDALQYSAIPAEKKGTQTDIYDLFKNMTGSYGPAIKTADLVFKKAFEPEKKEIEAIEKQEKEKNTRIPLEVLGNLGLIPVYKEIRKSVMKDIYKKSLEEKLLGSYENKEQMKELNPKLYERNFGKKSAYYKIKERQAKSTSKLKERIKERESRIKEKMKRD